MREFKTWRDPYEAGFSTCRPKQIQIESGLTVLVGCNGAGKTTLLLNIEDELNEVKIPVYKYDNLNNGGSGSLGEFLFNSDYDTASMLWSSSEGECISIRINNLAKHFRSYLETGKFRKGDKGEHFIEAMRSFMDDDKQANARLQELNKLKECKERWFLFDATDSGYSIDNVVELKAFFKVLIDEGKKLGKDVYVIISANEYELANGENCFDVMKGKYLTFADYNDYRKFILETRKLKEKRNEQAAKKREERRKKEEARKTKEDSNEKGWTRRR